MNIVNWIADCFSNRSKAWSLYKHGIGRAKKHDQPGAIIAYTAAIGMPEASPNVKAMALYNRALVYAAAGEDSQAIDDLNAILGMNEALANVKTEARRKLVRMQRRFSRNSI